MTSVESSDGSEGIGRDQCRSLFAWDAGGGASPGIDGGGDSGVGGAENPAIVFDGTHASLIEVLRISATIAIPAIVGDIHENLRSVIGELANFVGEDGFIADENAELRASCVERTARSAVFKLAHLFCEASGKRKYRGERKIFAKGNEMHFVVARNPLALRSDQGCGIEQRRFLIRPGGIAADRAHDDRRIHMASDLAHGVAKFSI